MFDNFHFSGSYPGSDVRLLLRPVHHATTPVSEKEFMIQSGQAHYSEMISDEPRPDDRYLQIYKDACTAGIPRIARDIRSISMKIIDLVESGEIPSEVTLCSLVRAGLPYGVLIGRDLRRLGIDAPHFGVSIIRDRGLDMAAMRHVLQTSPAGGVIFVDGWTGKGAISTELEKSWQELTGLPPRLAVIADPCGRADICGSREDWLIPSGILGGNISGLVSRSIRPKDLGPDEFDGVVELHHLADIDLTNRFIEDVDRLLRSMAGVLHDPCAEPEKAEIFMIASLDAVGAVQKEFGVENTNRIKPGIAEATRAVLRRRPEMVLVRDVKGDADIMALMHLCEKGQVPVLERPDLLGPYRAITLIGEVI